MNARFSSALSSKKNLLQQTIGSRLKTSNQSEIVKPGRKAELPDTQLTGHQGYWILFNF